MNKKLTTTMFAISVFRRKILRINVFVMIFCAAIPGVGLQATKKRVAPATIGEALQDYISKRFKNCGGDFYSTHVDVWGESYFQFKNVRSAWQPQNLSQADRLNGVQWKGVVYITSEVYRRTSEINKQWGGWADNFRDTGSATEQNGAWQIVFSGSTFHFDPKAQKGCGIYASLK